MNLGVGLRLNHGLQLEVYMITCEVKVFLADKVNK